MIKALAGIAVAAAVAAVVALALRDDDEATRTPREPAGHVQARIEAAIGALERDGIYVEATGQAAHCVAVEVVNPTGPNVAELRRRFADRGARLCFERSPGPAVACVGAFVRVRGRHPRVPDLRGLGLEAAGRRAVAAGFSYTSTCPGIGTRRLPRLPATSLAALARVTRQRPAPGTRWPVSRPIELEAVATLPGGFTYTYDAIEG